MANQRLLLLNASNMEKFPIYPYAFIQVPAIARQSGIEVICKDMLGIPQEQWKLTIETLIKQHEPVMILITLRNTDSCDSPDYEKNNSKENQSLYFPFERTRELIAAIREISNLKIVMGGFGFSLLSDDLMRYLRPDLGVYDGPDDFFAKFDDVKKGKLDNIANLLFFKGEQLILNPRKLYSPFADIEYTPQAIDAMMEFYASFPSPGFMGAAVEIMRGCNHLCVFCAEPHVKGARVRYRDLSVVMKDIEVLVNHGITKIYIISSELNPEGNEFVLELADRIWLFNEAEADDKKIEWYGANYLLKFENEEYKRLYRSGFTGGWFDITALDDKNARAMRTPYRNARLLKHLHTYVKRENKRLSMLRSQKMADARENNEAGNEQDADFIRWTMFLGNPATTIETIRNTLKIADEEGVSQLFGDCYLNPNIRVYDYEKPDKATLNVTYSITPKLERTGYRQIFPSFAYSPALLQHFGSEEEITRMFTYIADTYLSTKYRETRDWIGFLKQKSTIALLTTWVEELLRIKNVRISKQIRLLANGKVSPKMQRLFTEQSSKEDLSAFQDLAKQIAESILGICLKAFPDLFRTFGFPTKMEELEQITPYKMATIVFSRWSTEEALIRQLYEYSSLNFNTAVQDPVQFGIQVMLFKKNILVDPKYQDMFVSTG